jgi:hypothetical protein
MNPLLPDHPSTSQVNRHFLIGGLIIGGVLWAFPEQRTIILSVMTTVEIVNVGRNYAIGIKTSF